MKHRYFILEDRVINPYLVGTVEWDEHTYINEIYSIYNVTCVEMSETLYHSLIPLLHGKIIEIDEETAKWGSTMFGDHRDVIKIFETDSEGYPGIKVPQEVTPEMNERTINFMRRVAQEILELEFNRRYLTFRDASEIEVASWELQAHEAREVLFGEGNGNTPLLDVLAEESGRTREEMSRKILEKHEQYKDSLSELLVQYQKISKEFESVEKVWDMNILYEKYFGVQLPTRQAYEMKLFVSDDDWTRIDNPSINKFNF